MKQLHESPLHDLISFLNMVMEGATLYLFGREFQIILALKNREFVPCVFDSASGILKMNLFLKL